ncbi:MAG: LacI family DNA-binding transcriptional regulator [Rikenellaceae bacterium]
MKKSRVSIFDIAQELGVSPSTVSRALNNNMAISERMRSRVQSVANKMNYIPNNGARQMKTGLNRTIGVIVPVISRNFFASVIEGIEDYAKLQDYDVIICQSKDILDIEAKIVNSLLGKVDGIIISLSEECGARTHFDILNSLNIPFVLFDRSERLANASTVTVDDYLGAKMAIEHLISTGRRRIFHFAGSQSVSIWRNRQRGYTDAMQSAGIEVERDWLHEAKTNKAEGESYAEWLIERAAEGIALPEAIFCSGDYAALGILLSFKKHNIRVPEDVALVGFANEPFCEIITPSLSSVEQHSQRMGELACKSLLERMNGEKPLNIILEPEIIIRGSSADHSY